MTALTDFRTYISEVVQDTLNISIVPGKIEGPIRGNDLGCAYSIGARERANVTEIELEVRVRVFLNVQGHDPDPESPPDPSVLEAIPELVGLATSNDQEDADGSVWSYRLTEWEINDLQWGVEMRFVAVTDNPFQELAPMP